VSVTYQWDKFVAPPAAWGPDPYSTSYNLGLKFARHFGPTAGTGNVASFEAGNEPWNGFNATFYTTVCDGGGVHRVAVVCAAANGFASANSSCWFALATMSCLWRACKQLLCIVACAAVPAVRCLVALYICALSVFKSKLWWIPPRTCSSTHAY
jgi:hypothetical protein